MAGAVEHRAQQLGHARIGDQVAARLETNDPGEEPARTRDDAASRLDDQARRVGQMRPDRRRPLRGGSCEAASEVDALGPGLVGKPVQELGEPPERLRIGDGRADVRADGPRSDAGRSEALERRRQLVQRDPELGVRAAGGQVRMRVGVERRG